MSSKHDIETTKEEEQALAWLSALLQRWAKGSDPAAHMSALAHNTMNKILKHQIKLHDAVHIAEAQLAVAEGVIAAADINFTEKLIKTFGMAINEETLSSIMASIDDAELEPCEEGDDANNIDIDMN